jgi:hypothetical protein
MESTKIKEKDEKNIFMDARNPRQVGIVLETFNSQIIIEIFAAQVQMV